jgi:hypothetical protein
LHNAVDVFANAFDQLDLVHARRVVVAHRWPSAYNSGVIVSVTPNGSTARPAMPIERFAQLMQFHRHGQRRASTRHKAPRKLIHLL